MNITINGEGKHVRAALTIGELLEELGHPPSGVAVAVNLEFVPRSAQGQTQISEGDDIEIVAARQGG